MYGWMSREGSAGKSIRISGLFHPNIIPHLYVGEIAYNPLILTIYQHFLAGTSK